MPVYHPIFVHFPIALLSFAFAIEVVHLILRRPGISRAGWWTQLAGTVSVVSAVISGLFAEQTALLTEISRLHLDDHKELAFISAALFSALLLWRLAARTNIPPLYPRMYVFCFGVAVAALWWTSWFGGELVFRYGLGVIR